MMERDNLLGCNREALLSGYEQLRSDVLGDSKTGYMKGKGLVLVLRHGMFAWLKAWSECKGALGETEKTKEEAKVYMIPGDIKYQAAVLLANMAIHTRKEATSL